MCIRDRSNIQVLGLSEHATVMHYQEDLSLPTAIIMGSEEIGIRQKTLENCDNVISVSNNSYFKSLNVSVATGVILSEVIRQRDYA